MTDQLNIEIAGISIRIKCPLNGLSVDSDSAYESFLLPVSNLGSPDIEIDLKAMNAPYPRFTPYIFDSGQSWSMSRQDDDYYIVYKAPVSDRPVWFAETNGDFTKITVFCNTDLENYPQETGVIANPVRYPLDQIILMYYLAKRRGILIHAAGIEIKEKGYIFAGRSGAGKTTISSGFAEKGYTHMLSDDRVIVREMGNAYRVFGTPWPGEGKISVNRSIPLGGIFFLKHGDTDTVEDVQKHEALELLLPVASIPWFDPERIPAMLDFCDRLISHVPAYILHFRPGTGIVDALEKFIP
ncbi:MAG: hypothetical protein AB1442_00590 [Nitrospirota bacterium]